MTGTRCHAVYCSVYLIFSPGVGLRERFPGGCSKDVELGRAVPAKGGRAEFKYYRVAAPEVDVAWV